MRKRSVIPSILTLVGLAVPVLLSAQDAGLRQAADRVRSAWLTHDVSAMVDGDSVTLRLRGADEDAGPVSRAQAGRILARYLQPASEVAVDIRTVRAAGQGQGYAEATRRYVIRGTSDPMVETVLLGFRLAGGRWRLSEVRITP